MRVEFAGRAFQLQPNDTGSAQLMKLLAEQGRLTALIKRVSPSSLILEMAGQELRLPLGFLHVQKGSLIPGAEIEIERRGEGTLAFTILGPVTGLDAVKDEAPSFSSLAEHLGQLGMEATDGTLTAAEALLSEGYPVTGDLVRGLLPWIERGELAEALILLRARFPLNSKLVEAIKELGENAEPGRPLLHSVNLEPEEGEALARSRVLEVLEDLTEGSTPNRAAWLEKDLPRDIIKSLSTLFVQERLLETLAEQSGVVFALPYLVGEDLKACWLRITRDERDRQSEQVETTGPFRIELEIPTETLGTVGAELYVTGKNVNLSLQIAEEDLSLWQAGAEELERQLSELGWRLGRVEIGGWADEEGSRFTL